MKTILSRISKINELDSKAMAKAKCYIDELTKPIGSMGVLENIAIQLSGIYGNEKLAKPKCMLVIMAADHGLTAEKVSVYPQVVTRQMVENILAGGAGVNALLKANGYEFVCVDIGINGNIAADGLIDRKIRNGTNNISKTCAMTLSDAIKSINVGIEIADMQIDNGVTVLGIGEMGVGNTTCSSSVLKAFSSLDSHLIVGRGGGISDEVLARKILLVDEIIKVNKPDKNDAFDVLAKVGGLELGGLAGVIIGAASKGIPIVLDGFISGAAALIAYKLAPKVRDYMIPSHLSAEVGHKWIMDILKLKPYLDMGMRLGEGSGASIGFSFVDMAVSMVNNMATFDGAKVSRHH